MSRFQFYQIQLNAYALVWVGATYRPQNIRLR